MTRKPAGNRPSRPDPLTKVDLHGGPLDGLTARVNPEAIRAGLIDCPPIGSYRPDGDVWRFQANEGTTDEDT